MFEPVSASNPPKGSESWPVAEMREVATLSVSEPVSPARPQPSFDDLSRLLAGRIASAPREQRAGLVDGLNAEITRALSVTG